MNGSANDSANDSEQKHTRLDILQVGPSDPHSPGGVETHMRQLSEALARLGHQVTILAAGPTGRQEVRQVGPGTVRYEILPRPFGNRNIPPASWPAAVERAAAGKDIVHLHSYHQPHAATAHLTLRRQRSAGRPAQVLTAHYHGGGHSLPAELAHPLWKAAAGRRLVQGVGRNISVSEAEARLTFRDFRIRPTVIPNGAEPRGMNTERYLPGGQPADGVSATVITIARQTAHKNTRTIVDAVASDPRLTLIVVGDGPEMPDLARRAAAAPERIHLLGNIPEETLEKVWASADVYASASEKEAYGICVAEAAASGIPAVMSGISAHREAYGETEGTGSRYMTPHATAEQWAQALHQAAQAGRHSPDTGRGWDSIAIRTSEVYYDLAGAGLPGGNLKHEGGDHEQG